MLPADLCIETRNIVRRLSKLKGFSNLTDLELEEAALLRIRLLELTPSSRFYFRDAAVQFDIWPLVDDYEKRRKLKMEVN